MSMSIYAMNYYNNSLHNKQNDTKSMTEKTKETDMKQGELQENWGAAQLTQEKYREDGTVSMVQRMQGTDAYLQIKDGQPNSSENVSGEVMYSDTIRTDTITISEEGRLASNQMHQQSKSVDSLSNNNTVQQSQKETSKETKNQAEDLSEYTDTELKQMYYRGEITLQEYEDETGKVPGSVTTGISASLCSTGSLGS